MANEIDAHIGERLREARLANGMSQQDLAETVGISFQQVAKYEKGSSRIGASRLWEICNVLDTPVGFFFDGLDKKGKAKAVPPFSPEGRLSRRDIETARALNELRDEGVKAHFLRLIRDFERIG